MYMYGVCSWPVYVQMYNLQVYVAQCVSVSVSAMV